MVATQVKILWIALLLVLAVHIDAKKAKKKKIRLTNVDVDSDRDNLEDGILDEDADVKSGDYATSLVYHNDLGVGDGNVSANTEGNQGKRDFQTNFLGSWELVNRESGVSAMHVNLLPNNKIIVYDTKAYRISRLHLPPGVPCLDFVDDKTKEMVNDCWAHSIEYDIETNNVRPLRIESDPWCSAGGLAPDGTLVGSGGFQDGEQTVRSIGTCPDCQWQENINGLKERRWYPTQIILPNGEFLVVGGRRAFSYELVKLGQTDQKLMFFPFLYETTDIDENNLYPFVHLSTDGNVFIFANNRSIILNPYTNKIVKTLPVLQGGSRNYPASGMSALLPIKLTGDNIVPPTEVMVCGGNINTAFRLAETKKIFLPALQDCNRIVITDPQPKWKTERMPSRRTMGDLINLPNGELLFINGAQRGTAAWWDADEPNFRPVLYNPEKLQGRRFRVMRPSNIARMYHSTAILLPSGKIWVGGSNTHQTYVDVDKFPTETRVEHFYPPYFDDNLVQYKPTINEEMSAKNLNYGQVVRIAFTIKNANLQLTKNDIKVTIYPPPFTTHGYSMSQRIVILQNSYLIADSPGNYNIAVTSPPSNIIAPPGYYMLFVVHRGVPSTAMWVQIN